MDGGTGAAEEIIQGVGNEVFYFFMFLSLLLIVVGAWFTTQVVEPVVSIVLPVERSPVSPNQRNDGDGRIEYIQYRLDTNNTRPGVILGSRALSHGHNHQPGSTSQIQENYAADLQRITEPNSSNTDQTAATSQTDVTDGPSESGAVDQPNETSEQQQQQQPVLQPMPEHDRVTVRLKFLNDTERDVEASLLENLATFRQRNFTEEISENKSVRFIFNGQMLREESNTLRSYGMFDKCVVHCLIAQQPATPRASQAPDLQQDHLHNQVQEDDQDFDISELFIPVLGFGLIILWYFAFTYSNYFNSMSTSALLGLTSLFLFTLYGTNVHINVVTRN